MTTLELKKYINENDKVPFILEECGCHHIKDHGEYVSAGNNDGDNVAAINIYKNDWLNYVNYTRGVSGDMKQDIINLVESSKGISFVDALKWIHEILGLQYTYTKKPIQKHINKKDEIINIFRRFKSNKYLCDVNDIKRIDPKEFRDFEPLIYITWFKAGILPRTAKKFGLMYSYRWKRIIIPVYHWATGEIIGYNARTTVDNYDLLGISKFYITPGLRKENNVFGLFQNRKSIELAQKLIICESEKGLFLMDSRGDERWISLQGKTLSAEQRRIILGLKLNEVIISLDNDVPEEYVWGMAEQFYGLRKVSYTKDRWGLLGEKDSVTDLSIKKKDFMIKNRIVYDESLHRKYLKLNGIK